MRTSIGYTGIALLALLGAVLASPVMAQGAGGMGGCRGMQNGSAAGRGMASAQNGTRGWSLLTPDERAAFQKQMRAVKTYDECVALQTAHRGAMEVRAKERGVTLLTPRQNVCDNLRARAVID